METWKALGWSEGEKVVLDGELSSLKVMLCLRLAVVERLEAKYGILCYLPHSVFKIHLKVGIKEGNMLTYLTFKISFLKVSQSRHVSPEG